MTPEADLLFARMAGSQVRSLLALNPPDPTVTAGLAARHPEATVVSCHSDYSAYRVARKMASFPGATRERNVFAAWYAPDRGAHDTAVVFLPRERAATELALSMAAAASAPGATAWVVGRTRHGARGAQRLIDRFYGPASRVATGRHAVLYHAAVTPDAIAGPNLSNWASSWLMNFAGHEITVVSFPGVFSHGRTDPATRMLLETLPRSPGGIERVLDFGCGSGVIGAVLALSWPQVLTDMVDTNALALEATQRTLDANGLAVNRVYPSDAFSDVTGRFDLILSNPPFHSQGDVDLRVAEELVRGATEHLTPGGRLRIVANIFLRYPALIRAIKAKPVVVAQNRSYRVLEFSRPAKRR